MKLITRFILSLFILTFVSITSKAQNKKDSTQSIAFVRFEYGHFGVAGDLAKSFINSNIIGGSVGFKTATNWQFSLSGGGNFSTKVKDNGLLSNILNDAGDLTDADGELVKVVFEQRGYNVFANVSKILNIRNSNPNSGLITEFGLGFFQHKIKIDYRDGNLFQLDGEIEKGYDRLHNGIALRQFIGYQHFGPNNLANFYLGFELQEAFTKNRREYNYNTREYDKKQKTDILYGFRFGWIIPFKKRASEDFYYY
jgi:hypothetical protein